MEINKEVRNFWEEEACGTSPDLIKEEEQYSKAWFEEIEAKEVEHMGSYHCRKIRGSTRTWSQHSFGSAVDISHINGASLKDDWFKDNDKGRYLREAGKAACNYFPNVLTPDTNAAHHNHFHVDNGPRGILTTCTK